MANLKDFRKWMYRRVYKLFIKSKVCCARNPMLKNLNVNMIAQCDKKLLVNSSSKMEDYYLVLHPFII